MRYITFPWQMKGRVDQIAAWSAWTMALMSFSVIFFDLDVRVLLYTLYAWIPFMLGLTIRDFLRSRRAFKDVMNHFAFLERAFSAQRKEDLSPEDQEEISIITAKHKLRDDA